jgi:hypothetical protein
MAQTLLGGPRATLDAEEVQETLTGGRGGLWRAHIDVLDLADRPSGERLPITAGSVTWSYRPPDRVGGQTSDVAEVRRRCDLTLSSPPPVSLLGHRFRPVIEALSLQNRWVPWNLGVFVASIPALDDDGVTVTRALKLADKTFRLRTEIDERIDLPAGTAVLDYIRDRLTVVFGESRFALASSSRATTEPYSFNESATWLQVFNTLLEAIGYDQITYTEDGAPAATPLADITNRGPFTTYGPGAKVVIAGQVEPLLPILPNQVRFVSRQGPSLPEEGNGIRTVVNQSTGPASIDASEVRSTRVDVDAVDQAALDEIAAADGARYFAGGGLRWVGRVGLNPRFSERDVIAINRPRLGIFGDCLVTEWTLPLPVGPSWEPTMQITAERRVT